MNEPLRPIRYYPESTKMSLWESIRKWMHLQGWSRYKTTFREVRYGEDGYDQAPYGSSFLFYP